MKLWTGVCNLLTLTAHHAARTLRYWRLDKARQAMLRGEVKQSVYVAHRVDVWRRYERGGYEA